MDRACQELNADQQNLELTGVGALKVILETLIRASAHHVLKIFLTITIHEIVFRQRYPI